MALTRLKPIPSTDDDLILAYRAGDAAALDVLLVRYRRYARSKARSYFLVGADADDVEQEGMIGLYKAVHDYRPDREAGFGAFAELCVTRQVLSAVKGANRRKHQPLHRYVSTSGVMGGDSDDERSIEDLLDDHHVVDPAEHVCQQDGLRAMVAGVRELLTRLEVEVLGLYVDGWSYAQIGERLDRPVKSVDNALRRIKAKVAHHLAQRDAADRAEAWRTDAAA